jgi:hypothetical protein
VATEKGGASGGKINCRALLAPSRQADVVSRNQNKHLADEACQAYGAAESEMVTRQNFAGLSFHARILAQKRRGAVVLQSLNSMESLKSCRAARRQRIASVR